MADTTTPAKWHFLLHLESTYTQAKQLPVLQTHPRSGLIPQHRCLQAAIELDRQGLQRHYLSRGKYCTHSISVAGTECPPIHGEVGIVLVVLIQIKIAKKTFPQTDTANKFEPISAQSVNVKSKGKHIAISLARPSCVRISVPLLFPSLAAV